MKRLLLLALSFALSASVSNASDRNFGEYHLVTPFNFDFVAPSVTGESSLPETSGLIVFDVNANQFFGKTNTTGTGGWVQLSPPSGAGFVPAGTILPFAGTTVPSGFLLCDGTSYVRSTYQGLYNTIGTAYGSADGTHFNVPDLRGYFMRGADNMGTGVGGNDPSDNRSALNIGGNTSGIGSKQTDALQGHWHNVIDSLGGAQLSPAAAGGAGNYTANTATNNSGDIYRATTLITDGTNGAPRTSSESRPKNVAVYYIIKY